VPRTAFVRFPARSCASFRGGFPVMRAPATGAPLTGRQTDNRPEAIATALEVQRQFPRLRNPGTDIGLSNHGLVVNEANASPVHLTHQLAGHGAR
jgi:hypothetical protein